MGNRGLKLAALVYGALMTIPIGAHAYIGGFSRYIADDFCTAGTLRRLGFLESQVNWYQHWSGRYSFTFLVNLTQLLGPRLTPLLPTIALILWVLSATILFWRWLESMGFKEKKLISFLFATFIISTTLAGSPNVYQSLYWQTGMLTYTFPLIILSAYIGWLTYRISREPATNRKIWMATASAAVAFFAGGFSETFVSVQTAFLVLLLLSAIVFLGADKRKASVEIIGAGLLGSILAMFTIIIAPGNRVRQGLMPEPPGVLLLLERSLRDVYIFAVQAYRRYPEAIVLAIVLAAILGYFLAYRLQVRDRNYSTDLKSVKVYAVLTPPYTALLIMASLMPSEYAISSFPDGRVLITAHYLLMVGLVVWGFTTGITAYRVFTKGFKYLRPIMILVGISGLCLLMYSEVRTSEEILNQRTIVYQYAKAWDTRNSQLIELSNEDADIVPAASLRHMGGLAEVGRDPKEWINRCVADTYGLEAVIAK